MTEPQCRAVASGVVAALKRKTIDAASIAVASHDGGVRVLVTLTDGLMLDADIPRGHFNYDRVADAIATAMGRATMET